MFRAIILGAPASGKGTISSRIVKYFDVFHISMGDMLRREMKNSTKLGKEANAYIRQGKLVPDEIVFAMLATEMRSVGSKNWLLDGYPRTREQAEKLQELAKIDFAINLIVPFEVIIDRIKGRWVHVPSGRVYNENFNAPKVPGKDDLTGEPLEQREDDRPAAVKKRLESYREMIDPVLKFYKELNLVHDYYGNSSDEIWPKVENSLRLYLKPRK